MAKAHIYFFGGGHRTETVQTGKWGHCTYLLNGGNNWGGKNIYWDGGDTAHTLLMRGTIGWGGDTAQHSENQSRYTAGWVAGSVSDYSTTLWLHLAS